MRLLLTLCLAIAALSPSWTLPAYAAAMAAPQPMAQPSLEQRPTPVDVRWELASLKNGGLLAVLWLTPASGYKFYAADPGQTGMPTRVDVLLTPRATPLAVMPPKGKQAADLYEKDKTVFIHDGPTPFFVPLPAGLPPDFGLEAKIGLLACSDVSCWPMQIESSFSARQIPNPPAAENEPWWRHYQAVSASAPAGAPGSPAGASAGKPASPGKDFDFEPRSVRPHLEVGGLAKAFPLAVLAGMLLNLMPCVLPVACLKLSSLLAACHLDEDCRRHRRIRRHNLFFAVGILGYFGLLAVILGLAGLAWGQLFQQPAVLLIAAVVLFALGLSLFGVFHLPVIDLKMGTAPGKNPDMQAVVTGFLATLLATPCSGPFLGGVLAWTLLQPVAIVVVVFLGIGFGMAAPYLLLAARPELTRFVPRPGPWMTQLEKLAAFFIMAACLYFLSILPGALLLPALAALLTTAFAAYAWGAWTNLSQGAATRWGIRLTAVALTVWVCAWALAPPAPAGEIWKPFDKETFSQALGKENLFLDFTADWCPTCKALEKTVLTDASMATLAKRYGFTAIRVDLTREDPDTLALLRSLGSASIPLAAAFPKGEAARNPVVLRDLFTASQLEQTLKEAFQKAHEKVS